MTRKACWATEESALIRTPGNDEASFHSELTGISARSVPLCPCGR